MTNNYIILIEYPFYWNIKKILTSAVILPSMEWLPQYSTKVIIIDIIKQEIIKTLYTEPFFAMHHINSYEENNKIILDLIYYKDSNIINKFYLNNIKKLTNFPGGTIKRLIIDLNKDIINLQDYFTDIKIEMPNINLNYKTNKYRFFYSISNNSRSEEHTSELQSH